MEEFVQVLKQNKVTSRINFKNDEYLKRFRLYYENYCKNKTNKELKRIFRRYLKENGLINYSILNKDYYIQLGYSEQDSIKFVQEIQSKNATSRIKKYNKFELSSQSVWSKQYWKNKGYNDEEATNEVLNRNYSSKVGYSEDEYINVIKQISKKTKKAHKNGAYINSYNKISLEEIDFFKWLIENVDKNILHNALYINVKNSSITNKSGYSIDGYLKTENGIIGIEYDGLYWHSIKQDNIRDNEIFSCRNDIIGILRISSRYFKKEDEERIKKDILYGISEIKSKKRKKIRYY